MEDPFKVLLGKQYLARLGWVFVFVLRIWQDPGRKYMLYSHKKIVESLVNIYKDTGRVMGNKS